MHEVDDAWPGQVVPMVLRRTPPGRRGLSEAMTGLEMSPGDVWWELVDPAALADDPPAGAVVTRPAGRELTHVIAVQLGDRGGDGPPRDLLGQLIATLRGTQARAISMIPDERTSAEVLLDAGFVRQEDASSPDLHVLVL
jgi:hypothetical protein